MAYKDIEQKRAYQREYARRPDVKERRRDNYRKWAARNKEKLLLKEANRRLTKRGQCLVANCRTRAKKRGLPFDLDDHVDAVQERIDAGHCEITGCVFDLSPGKSWNSPSIDRISPEKGYTYDNIRLVCNAINAAMGDWGEGVVWEMFKSWQSMPKSPRRSSKRT